MGPVLPVPLKHKLIVGVVALVVIGLIWETFFHKPDTQTKTETKTETTSESKEYLKQIADLEQKLQVAFQQRDQQLEQLKQQQQVDRAFKGTETRIVGDSSQIAPLLAALAARQNESQLPVIVNNPLQPREVVPGSGEVKPVEITIRTGDSSEKVNTTTDKTTDKTTDTNVKVDETTTNKTKTEVKVDESSSSKTTEKTETKTGEGLFGGGDKTSPIGIGVSTDLKPILTYDAFSAPLGPKFLGLGRLGAGPFAKLSLTGNSDNKFTYGVQGNVTRKSWMIGVGKELNGDKAIFGFVGKKF
jgi:hypothetical protein